MHYYRTTDGNIVSATDVSRAISVYGDLPTNDPLELNGIIAEIHPTVEDFIKANRMGDAVLLYRNEHSTEETKCSLVEAREAVKEMEGKLNADTLS